jgi:hypothetical protein
MNHACLNCGKSSDGSRQWALTDQRRGLQGNWQLVQGDSRGVISMMPMPMEEQLAAYYSAYSQDKKVDLSRKRGSRCPRLRKLFFS